MESPSSRRTPKFAGRYPYRNTTRWYITHSNSPGPQRAAPAHAYEWTDFGAGGYKCSLFYNYSPCQYRSRSDMRECFHSRIVFDDATSVEHGMGSHRRSRIYNHPGQHLRRRVNLSKWRNHGRRMTDTGKLHAAIGQAPNHAFARRIHGNGHYDAVKAEFRWWQFLQRSAHRRLENLPPLLRWVIIQDESRRHFAR